MLRGVEPLELNSRRFVNLILYFLREGLGKDDLDKMNAAIESAGAVQHPWLQLAATTEQPAKPPPGWKSDKENWAGIQAFLGQMNTVKGAVSREKVG